MGSQLAIKDAAASRAKPRKQLICFLHDPASGQVCPSGDSCVNQHLDTRTANGAEHCNRVKTIYDRANQAKATQGKDLRVGTLPLRWCTRRGSVARRMCTRPSVSDYPTQGVASYYQAGRTTLPRGTLQRSHQ